jgi:hypothetical protein
LLNSDGFTEPMRQAPVACGISHSGASTSGWRFSCSSEYICRRHALAHQAPCDGGGVPSCHTIGCVGVSSASINGRHRGAYRWRVIRKSNVNAFHASRCSFSLVQNYSARVIVAILSLLGIVSAP